MYWNKLLKCVQGHAVYIQPHDFPDPDALASAFALQSFLEYYQISSEICYAGRIETRSTLLMLEMLEIKPKRISEIKEMSEKDYIINVDAQKGNANITDVPGKVVACIDHHPLVGTYPYQYQDVRKAGSCSSLVAGYFYDSGVPIGKKEATALLYGIHIDTNQLRRGLTDLDVDMYHYLYPRSNTVYLNQLLSSKLEYRDLKAFGTAINNVQIIEHVGFAYIPFDCPDALLGMLSDFILSLDVVNCSVVYTLRPEGLKVSVRCSAGELHAGQIIKEVAESFGGGGGGHAEMAGGFIPKASVNMEDPDWENQIRTRFLEIVHQSDNESVL